MSASDSRPPVAATPSVVASEGQDTSAAGSAVQGTAERQSFASRWRVGRRVGRTIYRQVGPEPSDNDVLIGVMDTPELAREAVEAVNRAPLVEDEGTVERVARAMADTDGWGDKDRVPLSQVYDYTRLARAALQALREGGTE